MVLPGRYGIVTVRRTSHLYEVIDDGLVKTLISPCSVIPAKDGIHNSL